MIATNGEQITRQCGGEGRWTFLTNHGLALLQIAQNPTIRLSELASGVGVTERTAQTIVTDLVSAGYVTRTRVGRRSHYSIKVDKAMRHKSLAASSIELLLALNSSAMGSPESGVNPTPAPRPNPSVPSDPRPKA